MACDHLDKKTFDNAMEEIKRDYNNIYKEYSNGLAKAMKAYYDAWQSKKGWDKINALYGRISTALDRAGVFIRGNYNIMKNGAENYAKKQDMFLWIGEINVRNFEMTKKTFNEDSEIIIDEDKIKSAGTELSASLKKLNSYIDNSKNQTSSDVKFGYYSTGDALNPREEIHHAYVDLDSSLNFATEQFIKDFEAILEEDKTARDQAKQDSAVEASDFSGIF